MLDTSNSPDCAARSRSAREWTAILSAYRGSNYLRSTSELALTIVPFVLLWALAWWLMSTSYWMTLAVSVLNAALLLRLFAIQHDCGHGAFFESRTLSDWVGRAIGVLTLTPYDVWRRSHSEHHSSSGNLGRRGMGDIYTMTLAEYRAASTFERIKYRLYRHPITLYLLVPGYLFYIQNRLPVGLMGFSKYWISAMATNAAIAGAIALIAYFGGLLPILLIFVPTTLLAATAGVWLFYVQHQFETTHWETEGSWELHEAAFEGSSYYLLPPVLQWFSANIGIHHVHHLSSRVPFYRLPEVLRDHAELAGSNRISIRESIQNTRLHLWDEDSKRLLSFAEARDNSQHPARTP